MQTTWKWRSTHQNKTEHSEEGKPEPSTKRTEGAGCGTVNSHPQALSWSGIGNRSGGSDYNIGGRVNGFLAATFAFAYDRG